MLTTVPEIPRPLRDILTCLASSIAGAPSVRRKTHYEKYQLKDQQPHKS